MIIPEIIVKSGMHFFALIHLLQSGLTAGNYDWSDHLQVGGWW